MSRLKDMRALTLKLDDEIFAIEADGVREILDMVPITKVPNASRFASGLVNVRGRIVPLADLRVAFGMRQSTDNSDTRIIVVESDIEGEPTIVAILADKVYDVTDISLESIEDVPKVGMKWRADYVRGVGKRQGQFIIIPDLQRILASEGRSNEPSKLEKAATH